MNEERWIDPRIQNVHMLGVEKYLRAHGWRNKPYPHPELLVYEGPPDDDGQPIVQVFPAEQCSDFRRGLARLITNLSVIEDRHPVEVLNDILQGTTAEAATPLTHGSGPIAGHPPASMTAT